MSEQELPPRADFHVHSTASDGTTAPGELVRRAARRGLSHLAITDHDTVRGIREALTEANAAGIDVIAGIELSVDFDHGELHILGYGIDPENHELATSLEAQRQARVERAWKILERLGDLGIELDPAVLTREHPGDSVGRPHIARALVEIGAAESVADAFDRYLGSGKPAHVRRPLLSPGDAIRLIRAAGGIGVMAHPHSVPDHTSILPVLVDLGLAGLECYYGAYNRSEHETLAREAGVHGLVATGGSDYHGPGVRDGRELGSVDIPPAAIAGFLAALGR